MNPFTSLGLSPEIVNTLNQLGFEEPTDIQKTAIPIIMAGNDLLAIAQTGTGKTATYALPTIERLKRYANNSTSPAMHPVRMLVLVPTRELAQQVQENIALFVQHIPLRYAVLYGGTNINPQIEQLRQGIEILIATVGRLNDLIEQKAVQLNKVEIVILDEADKMLDIGFFDDICKIFSHLPNKKQTALFSATFSKQIELLTKEFLYQPQRIEIAPKNTTNINVVQHFVGVDNPQKRTLLYTLISELNMYQVIIFCNTKATVERVAHYLTRKRISVLSIHGDKTQSNRTDTLLKFKQGNIQALVATDVAARGLDIEALPFVINYDLPQQVENYVHRIGRTGRAGANGVAISLVEESNIEQYQNILSLTKQNIRIEFIDLYKPYWYQKKKIALEIQNPSPLSEQLNTSRQSKENTLIICQPIPGRKKYIRKKEDCALLLPNYGLDQSS
ncbi:MAG: DEAD/DEAH box helicase [Neisseriaceae bacterium]|nr:MAG: DEAD/DEAH box helicase [Neisseriaceae bacterium]